MRDWIDTTIKDRGVFERISSELKGYMKRLEVQQKDGIQRLKTFEEQHIQDKNDLLEKVKNKWLVLDEMIGSVSQRDVDTMTCFVVSYTHQCKKGKDC